MRDPLLVCLPATVSHRRRELGSMGFGLVLLLLTGLDRDASKCRLKR
jgi:hypothetical protein